MATPYKTLNIEIADYKAAVERWTTILKRTHSWRMPQYVTIEACAASSTEIEQDMIKMGVSRLRASIEDCQAQFEAQVLTDFASFCRSPTWSGRVALHRCCLWFNFSTMRFLAVNFI
jgi:hypothetical protein